jgi:plastocyanin
MATTLRFPVLALTCLLALTACGGGDDDGGSDGDGGGSQLEVSAQDFQFSPNSLSVDPGEEVTIVFSNEGEAPHTFTAPDIDADVRLDPGGSEEISFTAPDSGSIDWMCTIHTQMTGTIAVGGGEGAGSGGGGGKDDTSDDPYDY